MDQSLIQMQQLTVGRNMVRCLNKSHMIMMGTIHHRSITINFVNFTTTAVDNL